MQSYVKTLTKKFNDPAFTKKEADAFVAYHAMDCAPIDDLISKESSDPTLREIALRNIYANIFDAQRLARILLTKIGSGSMSEAVDIVLAAVLTNQSNSIFIFCSNKRAEDELDYVIC